MLAFPKFALRFLTGAHPHLIPFRPSPRSKMRRLRYFDSYKATPRMVGDYHPRRTLWRGLIWQPLINRHGMPETSSISGHAPLGPTSGTNILTILQHSKAPLYPSSSNGGNPKSSSARTTATTSRRRSLSNGTYPNAYQTPWLRRT